MTVKIYDTTLRDGAQQEKVSFSVSDKIKVAKALIDFGVDYVEGGFPGSNPKDSQFFEEAKNLDWKNTKLVAFCATRHKKNKPEEDLGLKGVVNSGVKTVTVFGKTWSLHAEKILGVSKKENFDLIYSTISFLKKKGLEVIFDAEHFFDGYFDDADFALECLEQAVKAGADNLTLCDTNGGMLPWQVEEATKVAKEKFPKISIGIHAHNDSGTAEANSLGAVRAGADMVHVTVNGYGERTGNANLCVVVPDLALKMGKKFINKIDIKKLTWLSAYVAEVGNMRPPKRAPFVGKKSFTHKAGVHVAAVSKLPESYEHIDPAKVGNSRKVTVSELSGQTNIIMLARELGYRMDKGSSYTKKVLQRIKNLESEGYVFEASKASLELLLRRMHRGYNPPFKLVDFLLLDRLSRKEVEAEVQVQIGDKLQTKIAFGNGPVNALDKALREALIPYFPELKGMKLLDYKVRILDTEKATGATTRVLIESGVNGKNWTTIGCGENITKASLRALTDALEYSINI